ncbi:MAG: sigma-70 family RNA polymerase sigma factor [Gammaproteobacteria bacterium]|nr:sigma-70 family RNA polymerase sigma factor [Gammaproteobacteria bacterium]
MSMFLFACKDKLAARQVRACRDRLYRIAYSWCHDAMLADDLAQETLAKAIQKLDQLRNRDSMDAWLFTILNNQWREFLRRSRPCEDIENLVYMHEETPEVIQIRQQKINTVQQAISELPLAQRQVLTLVDIEGLSYMNVAEVLEVPIGTVMSRLSRARSSLEKKLRVRENTSSVINLRSVK